MAVMKRLATRALPVVAAVALVVGQSAVAGAAPNTISVVPTDPTPSASTTYTWTWSGFQTATPVKCVKVQFNTAADGSGSKPTGLSVSGASALAGTYLPSGTWTADATSAGSGVLVYNYSTGVTPAGSGKTITISNVTNPSSAGTNFMIVTTYDTAGGGSSGACGGAALDAATAAAFVTTTNTQVSVIVDPSFTFSVANKATACNGESNYVDNSAGLATSLPLGHLSSSQNASSGQTLTVSGNAGSGFTVYLRGLNAAGNMRNAGASYMWQDVSGTYGSAAALGAGERFGYTFKDSTTSSSVTNPSNATFVKLTNTGNSGTGDAVMGSASSQTGSACVSYDAQTGTNASSISTPAGSYAATIVYTAVPVF